MIEHNKNFYSLEELKRTRDSLEGFLDNEEVYYFVGAIRYACDDIERLHSIIEEVREYAKEMQVYCIEFESWGVPSKEILEILDKENNNG